MVQRIILCLLFGFTFIWEKTKKPPQWGEYFGEKKTSGCIEEQRGG
jgi:hypothetical protein